jgi:hypothetical protein
MALTKATSIMTTQATSIAELKTYGASMSDGDSLEILGYSTAGDGGGGTFYWDATSTAADNGGTIIQATGVTTGRWLRVYSGSVNVKWFGANETRLDNEVPIHAAIAVCISEDAKLTLASLHMTITDTIKVSTPITIDGERCQIFQSTPDKDVILFSKELAGNGNYVYNDVVENIFVGGVAGTGNGFVFENRFESTYTNLLVVGVGNIAFHIKGCLLCNFEHLYVGNGLSVSPAGGFFGNNVTGNAYGIYSESYNAIACNSNVYTRCVATNSTITAFTLTGTNNLVNGFDAEGLATGSLSLHISGDQNRLQAVAVEIGNIEIHGSRCMLSGTLLCIVSVKSTAKATVISEAYINHGTVAAGAINTVFENIRLDGSISNSGTNTTKRNILDASDNEQGQYKTETFIPTLSFGGNSVGIVYAANTGLYKRIGDWVHIEMRIVLNNKGSSVGSAKIEDLPFNSKVTGYDKPISGEGTAITQVAGSAGLMFSVKDGVTGIEITSQDVLTGTSTNITDANFSNSSQIRITGNYLII